MRTRSVLAGVSVVMLLGGLLAGCASSAGSDDEVVAPTEAPADPDLSAAWLDSGRMVGIVTLGSSSCVPMADVGAYADGVLEVTLIDDAEAACTRDLVPRVTLAALPAEVDPSQDLEIRVVGDGYQGVTELDGVAGLESSDEAEMAPSAGWANDEGQFVLLSWGSSSCVPVVESAEATSATEVTVTFMTPPADQPCTMDFAPRATVAWVDPSGLDVDAGVDAMLTGGEFADVTVPIIG
ncbi:hypothetical protein ACWPKO_27090 (plasmid) [Coraliomargarita sp. W4R53]